MKRNKWRNRYYKVRRENGDQQKQLIDRRNQYISEIMKGIQILHGQEPMSNCMNYKIVFENIVRIEK